MAGEGIATELLEETFPFLRKDKWPSNIMGPFVPLVIKSCNAFGNWTFPKASLDVVPQNENSFPEIFLYRGAMFDLVFNKCQKISRDQAVERLGKFLADKLSHIANGDLLDWYFITQQQETHLECLRKIRSKERMCDAEIQSTLMAHLFKPLVPNCQITVNDRSTKAECPGCKTKLTIGDTSFGNRRVWHGTADAVLDAVVINFEKSNDEYEGTEDERNELGSEAPIKRRKLNDARDTADIESDNSDENRLDMGSPESSTAFWSDEDSLTSVIEVEASYKNTYMPYGPENIGHKSNEVLSQVLAQTIVNGFMLGKGNLDLEHCFFPCVLVSEEYITIHMYNPDDDVLLTQPFSMNIWETDESDSELNSKTILSLWLALNMHNFSKCLPHEPNKDVLPSDYYTESGFHKIAEPVLEIYKNKLKAPLDLPEKPTKKHRNYNFDSLLQYVQDSVKHERRFLGESYQENF